MSPMPAETNHTSKLETVGPPSFGMWTITTLSEDTCVKEAGVADRPHVRPWRAGTDPYGQREQGKLAG